jgi:segregation and condensation protein A
MKDPTFRLEGVIKSKESAEDFEGPLILILHLLSKNKIEIKDIKISLILEQYLQYLDEMKQMDLEIASEFIAMASHLTYIKAKTLLAGEQEEISELEALQNSLEELKHRECYQKIKLVAAELTGSQRRVLCILKKPPEALPKEGQYGYSHDVIELRNAMAAIMGKRRRLGLSCRRTLVIPVRLIYPVGEKAEQIMLRLRDSGA